MILQTIPIAVSFAQNKKCTITLHTTERRANKSIRSEKCAKVFLLDIETLRELTFNEQTEIIDQKGLEIMEMAAEECGVQLR